MKKLLRLPSPIKIFCLFLVLTVFNTDGTLLRASESQSVDRVAILPFDIHSDNDLSYLQRGIFHMLSSRLAWKGHIEIVPEIVIQDHINALSKGKNGQALAREIGNQTQARYTLSGSITEFGGSFSLDTRVDTGSAQQAFYQQVETPDQIIPAMDAIAAKINQSLFHRTIPTDMTPQTPSSAKTEAETNARANPETLIPQAARESRPPQRPFWKIWKKKEPPPVYPDEVPNYREKTPPVDGLLLDDPLHEPDHLLEEKVPFWKFWKKGEEKKQTEEEQVKEDEETWEEMGKKEKPFWKFW